MMGLIGMGNNPMVARPWPLQLQWKKPANNSHRELFAMKFTFGD